MGIYDSALIIITTDHGESLGDHRELTHSYFVYQSTIRAGLIFKLPGKNHPKRIDDYVALVDIMPTTLALMGFDIPEPVHGQNLSRYFQQDQYSQQQPRYIYCESLHPTQHGCAGLRSVVCAPWKYIHTTRPELYNLRRDPQEKNNLIADNPQQAKAMEKRLKNILAHQTRPDAADSILEIDPASVQILESLGYISVGKINDSFQTDSEKEDPKDFFPLYETQRQVKDFICVKMYDKAKDGATQLIQARPDNAAFRLLLGQVAFEQNDIALATKQLTIAAQMQPENHEHLYRLGQLYMKNQRYDEAMEYFHQAIRLKPSLIGYQSLAAMAMSQGKMDEAFSYYNKVIDIEPADATAHHKLGLICLARRQPDQAQRHFAQTLKANPKNDQTPASLAMSLAQLGRIDEACTHFVEAIRLNPDNPIAHGSYANLLAQQGRLDEALEHFINAARINPNNYMLQNNIARLYFRMGKIDQAVQAAQKAIDLAMAAGQAQAARQIQQQMDSYKKQKSNL